MDKQDVLDFVAKQKTAFIASIGEEGYPVVRAMLAPRKIEGNALYFTTNTSSNKVKQYLANDKACVYFYQRGMFKYRGACLFGEMAVCTDQPTKDAIWRAGDQMFYRQGVIDPDYCVLRFTCTSAEYYCDLKTETIVF